MPPAAAPLNLEAEFDRVVSAFLPHRVHPSRREGTVDGETSGAEAIYRRALEIIDAYGVSVLTFRKLADDLKMSTRTVRKRVGHRDRLIRAAVEYYVGGITVDSDLAGPWEDAVHGWCGDLHGQLMGHPRITELMIDTDGELIDQQVRRIADYAVHEGIPFDVAHRCCKSLARLTINDAIARSRAGATGGEPSAHAAADAPLSDTVRWVVAGVRVESVVGGANGMR